MRDDAAFNFFDGEPVIPSGRCSYFQADATLSNAAQAFTLLDFVARMALHAVCRSCHVRLHQATLDTVLDEQPLTEGVPASSVLQVQFHGAVGFENLSLQWRIQILQMVAGSTFECWRVADQRILMCTADRRMTLKTPWLTHMSRNLQVQQSMMSSMAPDLDQEAAATDEVLPHGLVSVVSAQNALTWEQNAHSELHPVAASMLQVRLEQRCAA